MTARQTGARAAKKARTRQRISDVATGLFIARGFDAVSVAEIADAAGVSKMTVFNYFERKEDLFLDRDQEARAMIREAIHSRPSDQTALAALHRLARDLVVQNHPLAKVTRSTDSFWRTVRNSRALRARARELRRDLGAEIAAGLAGSIGRRRPDALARLLAATLTSAWDVAYAEAMRLHRAGTAASEIQRRFLELLDRGFAMAGAGAKGTPYA